MADPVSNTAASGALTSKALNTTPVVDKAIPYDEIEARPLTLPDFTDIKPKNPNVVLRWIKFSSDSDVGRQRFAEASYQGFRPARLDEVTGPTQSYVKDNRLVYGDLIACVIDRKTYVGALKYKENKARDRVDHDSQLARGRTDMKQAVTDANAPRSMLSKLQVFQPGADELRGLVGTDKSNER